MPSGRRAFGRGRTGSRGDRVRLRNRTMDPMPSGGKRRRFHHRGHREHRGTRECALRARKGSSVRSVSSVVDLYARACRAPPRIRAMDPMPSGGAGDAGAEGAGAAELGAGRADEGADFGGAGAVLPAGAAATGEALGRARAGAAAAVETAAAVGHGGLAALAAAAGAGAAAGRGQEVAGAVAVLQLAAAGEGRLRDACCESEQPSFARRSGLREGGWTPCQAVDDANDVGVAAVIEEPLGEMGRIVLFVICSITSKRIRQEIQPGGATAPSLGCGHRSVVGLPVPGAAGLLRAASACGRA